ncbi:MAG: hypothetical protein MNPFHGCM_00764 [Gemmatimonadaceae bacterium]|nr:hypothetical protein [Gemmatimonadaceae bacterium]
MSQQQRVRVRTADVGQDVSAETRTVPGSMSATRRLLEYARLAACLMADRRVSLFDRLLVVLAVAYLVSPLDFIPDMLPVIGQVDDVMILVACVTRLFEHAGRAVILSHWRGARGDLDARWLKKLALVVSIFIPKTSRRRLRSFSKA